MARFLALDQGSSSSRAAVFDTDGHHTAVVQKPLPVRFPRPGWVEHDPAEIWHTQLDAARDALLAGGSATLELSGIAITNQRETTLVWSRRSGAPIGPAISWQDRRTVDWCEARRAEGLAPLVRERTGLVIDPYFSAGKIAWLLDHLPGARQLAEAGELAFGTVDSWLIWKLTNGAVHATDVTNASRTMLFNLERGAWDPELCERLRIPMALLPQVKPSASYYGDCEVLGGNVSIMGVAGDQQAALFGHGCLLPGQAKNTYGTGCFVLLHTGEEAVASKHGLLTTRAAQISRLKEYALEGAVFDAGSVVQWLRDEVRLFTRTADIEPLAASVPDTGGVVLVPAFNGLGSPYWDPSARAGLLGMTRGTSRAHIARAALESIALQSTEVLLAMQADAATKLTELVVDGGASANNLLMQMQADLLGVPVRRPANIEATAFGAASIAAHTTGTFQHAENQDLDSTVFQPVMSRDEAAARLDRWRMAVGRVGGWA
ncbi:glycerol kinase GlpK [Derxia gummosa]|uniref:glycerol kinase n=1 Tax=Derxia gummosa DSM 723 TaxID=1121388 RepID=A0A8B6X3X2_9BURK|nr:glycerol kinase GlpK [Derxia gummosa]